MKNKKNSEWKKNEKYKLLQNAINWLFERIHLINIKKLNEKFEKIEKK